jgi:N-acetylmuramic acid 6-phosphate etherase
MSAASDRRTAEFLAIADQFRLGHLVTESAHPLTRDLSGAAEAGVDRALELLFAVDADVVEGFRRFTASGLALEMGNAAAEALSRGGRLFFTGCGATGRLSIQLDSIWRKYWRRMDGDAAYAADMADRTFSVMAGGDFALIKSVEGFEDYASFGKKQITDLGVGPGDVVFAITEGGETSFVIGTAWAGLEAGAKVYFVYNNPDDLLRSRVARSREVLDDDRIRNVNLTTGPMAIRGSTRMQATSSELIAMVTVLETALCLLLRSRPEGHPLTPERVGPHTLAALEQAHAELKAPSFVCSLARLATLEEAAYRCGAKATYHADGLGIDVLTDTTERSPTFCTPPFRKFDDPEGAESWVFLFTPPDETPAAWTRLLGRAPRTVQWNADDVRSMVDVAVADRQCAVVNRIGGAELMRFRIGQDGLQARQVNPGDVALAIATASELTDEVGRSFYADALNRCAAAGARAGLLLVSPDPEARCTPETPPGAVCVRLPVPRTDLMLDGVTRVAAKMALNALSTSIMVRLGRVMGNTMIWVVPSNLKLIDRATRYVADLAGMEYAEACADVHEAIEYVAPRMEAGQTYPPVVGLVTLRALQGLTFERAEEQLLAGHGPGR